MDFKFSKDATNATETGEETPKKNQNALLVLLVIIVAGFGYIYFFTGLIKPQTQTSPAPQAVKQPIPPRDGVATTTKKVEATEAAKPAAPAKSPTPATPAKPSPVAAVTPVPKPLPPPAPPVAAKPATTPPKAPVPPKAVKPVTPTAAKPAAAIAAKPAQKPQEQKKASTAQKPGENQAKKSAADGNKTATEPKLKQALIPKKQHKEQPMTLKETSSGKWTVQIGSYVLEEALATDLVRVRKAGLDANVVSGGRKSTKMNRLQVGEFADRDSAQAELAKLKKHTSDAFIVDNGGGTKFTLYAGSYLLDSRAASEKERLSNAGYKMTLKRVEVPVPTRVLTAGTFSDKKTADDALKKLKNAGIKAELKQH